MRKFIFLAVSVGLLCTGLVAARAEVRVADVFGNSMVLQRDMAVPVWGWADPGEEVTVEFGGQKVSAKTGADGKWKLALKSMPVNATSQNMTVKGGGQPIVFKDVLVGDVWLCSGQSNMGLELRKAVNAQQEIANANYPLIRGVTIWAVPNTNANYVINPSFDRQRYALTPQDHCKGLWSACTPTNAHIVQNWSGVAYFYARDLFKKLNVPIGIIISSYGATAIEAWASVEGLKEISSYRERAESLEDIIKLYVQDTNNLARALEEQKAKLEAKNKVWFAKLDAEEPGLKDKWMSPALDVSKWGTVQFPTIPNNNPIGAVVASIWFRKDVTVPADWVGKDLELQLGVVDGTDEAYINGTRVGRTWFDVDHYWIAKRVYPVPASAVTSTNVALVMRVLKLNYPMAFWGPASNMVLTVKGAAEGSASVTLTGEWRMAKSQDLDAGQQPKPAALLDHPPGAYYGCPSVQYNGQIHPLIPYAIKGAIWYQGEANAPFFIDYRTLMPGLITSWRKEWNQGDFPFGIVALADYQGQQTTAVERGYYHLIRDAQQMCAFSLTNTFIGTAVGAGEGADIHPKNKQEVGRRLALAALGIVYGQKDKPWYGPIYKSATVEGDKIRLHFDFAKGLHSQGEPPVGFAIAGADRAFYFAHAKIEGETVVVWSEKVPKPVGVRYAWASNPICNVYNSEELPMFQFHSDDWDWSQIVIPKDTPIIPAGWVPK